MQNLAAQICTESQILGRIYVNVGAKLKEKGSPKRSNLKGPNGTGIE